MELIVILNHHAHVEDYGVKMLVVHQDKAWSIVSYSLRDIMERNNYCVAYNIICNICLTLNPIIKK